MSEALERQKERLPTSISERRRFVNRARDEYVDMDPVIARKVDYLLRQNIDVRSSSVEHIFALGDKIQGANCHKTAPFLTGEFSESQLFAPDNDNPETAGQSYIEQHSHIFADSEDIEEALTKHTFPFRVSFL